MMRDDVVMRDDIVRKQAAIATVDPERVITQAIEHNVPVETMERLLAMRRELMEENARAAFERALCRFQAQSPIITKSKSVMNRDGKTVRYRYAPLEDIVAQTKALLAENGFSYTIRVKQQNNTVTSTCVAMHEHGHTEESSMTVPVDPEGYMTAPQKVAAAITFAKRYAFCNVFGILTGDDDDDAISADYKPPRTAETFAAAPVSTPEDSLQEIRAQVKEAAIASAGGDVAAGVEALRQLRSDRDYPKLTEMSEEQLEDCLYEFSSRIVAKLTSDADSGHVDESLHENDMKVSEDAESAATTPELPSVDKQIMEAIVGRGLSRSDVRAIEKATTNGQAWGKADDDAKLAFLAAIEKF